MQNRRLFGNVVWAFGAQGTAFLCSVLITLVVPKLLSIEEFGFWQLFVFYSSYVSFFQLGLNDGVYLRFGGQRRQAIDKSVIKAQLGVGLLFQSVIAVAIAVVVVLSGVSSERSFVLYACAIYLVISNATYFFGYVFQAMNETRKYSFSTILDRGSFLLPLVACVVLGVEDFRVYVIFTIGSRLLALIYVVWGARDFLAADSVGVRLALSETARSMRIGIVLTFANISGMLTIGVMRIVVDHVWGIETFGQLSLALSIVNFAMAFISQVAMVLFPELRQVDSRRLSKIFRELRNLLGVVMPLAYLAYFPLALFVSVWLPNYAESLVYFVYLMPICVFEAQTNVCTSTFLKVRNEPGHLLGLNAAALAASIAGIACGVLVFRSVVATVVFAVVGVVLRYVLAESYLHRVYQSSNRRLVMSGIIVSVTFVASAINFSMGLALATTAGALCVFLLLNRRESAWVIGRMVPSRKG
ncbi:MAG: lipopolysaccharide biosynthesis protein [Ancrocorticia sp.]|uniref:lipopolysaccharide biosynthesis protein n=1 Tax=Ancrocorticia sp. TaxID=2593684 RepID=UPI003F8E56F0